jgi:hypothetical protein
MKIERVAERAYQQERLFAPPLTTSLSISIRTSGIRPEKVMPVITWVGAEGMQPAESFEEAQQQQQQ